METKRCSRCEAVLPLHQFRFDNRAKNLRKTRCRECENARMRADRKKHGPKRRATERDHYRRNADTTAVQNIIRRYGLTEPEAAEAAAATTCDLCGMEQTGGRRIVVDHCHTTGNCRGLLCDNCNIALGKLKDDVELILRAATYVQQGGFGRYAKS